MTHSKSSDQSPTLQSKPNAKRKKKDATSGALNPSASTPAMVHDLQGFALIALPSQLRPLLGDAALFSNAQEIAELSVTCIVRETGLVVYVQLPVLVKEIEDPSFDLKRGGMTLRDITHPDAGQPKPRRSKKR
jgi:hypothetical protein